MSNVSPIFRSRTGYIYPVQDLIDHIRLKGYLCDFQYSKEFIAYPAKPFTVEEINQILSIEEVFSAYRVAMDKKLAMLLQESAKIEGDTLELMENLLKAFEEGAKAHGGLPWFLNSDDFINRITAPIEALYSHLKKHPLEEGALTSISSGMSHQFNFVNYLQRIIEKGDCSSGFPNELSEMFSLVLSLKLYMHHEEQRMSLNTNEQEPIQETAFFDVKPMTNYHGIQIKGLTTQNPETEETLKKLIEYLDTLHINRYDIPTISVNGDQITIQTKQDREFKTHLRETILSGDLGLDTQNISGHYKFIISDLNDLGNKLSNISLKEREGILKQL
ncbi:MULTISPECIES: hypothetical protein [Legionella]|uniref:Uncharacterized protein n=1 Tax=Legionella resiliens TaxID=2905958 RepID=A0ABS8XDQ0_9GAMM|nr:MULTISPECIES: hypothetical protein [unclassified Legionella]MCE0724770.1 hypothetical protein [Legionella sp. 9fVS26]MCE3533924.1 hypothetical protein [Legionella sp. 8cVS16]QLZ70158.1 hypothetical protein FOLKNPGA_02963 [Legionella sp. PC1000]